MKKGFNQMKQNVLLVFFLFTLIQVVNCQIDLSEDDYYKVFDNFVGLENSEINNGAIFLQQYRTMDNSHMFFSEPEFLEGQVVYKNQPYNTKLKYDLLNDLIVVTNVDNSNALPIHLNSNLVDSFLIDKHHFVKLTEQKDLVFLFENGFFEEMFKGQKFDFYIKHIKKLKKNTTHFRIYYFFIEEQIFLLKYDNQFYEIKNKKDIIKVVPHLKKDIKDFFGHLRTVNALSLTRLFAKIDKKDSL